MGLHVYLDSMGVMYGASIASEEEWIIKSKDDGHEVETGLVRVYRVPKP